MRHYIKIEEVRSMVVEVEADSLEQAIAKTENAYIEGNVCLNDPCYVDDEPEFWDVTERADWYETNIVIK